MNTKDQQPQLCLVQQTKNTNSAYYTKHFLLFIANKQANQLIYKHRLNYTDKGDFMVDERYCHFLLHNAYINSSIGMIINSHTISELLGLLTIFTCVWLCALLLSSPRLS